MKNLIFALVVVWASLLRAEEKLFSLPLDLSSEEYAKLNAQFDVMNRRTDDAQSEQLKKILAIGKRNLDWVEKINSVRPEPQWILLSTKETQQGIPIDKPRLYNAGTVIKDFQDNLASLPPQMAEILTGNQPLTSTIGTTDPVFTEGARKIDRSYQMASRWLLLSPFLGQLAARRSSDIRGYYFLSRLPNLQAVLKGFNDLPAADKTQVEIWLLQMCYVAKGNDNSCKNTLADYLKNNKDLNAFYGTFLNPNKTTFDNFFKILGRRNDIKASQQGGGILFSMPFLDPQNPAIWQFVKANVEDEWRGPNWQLRLNAVISGGGAAHIVFEAGATPHVNGIAGSTITMDKNLSLKDYNNNWTIRHEYGHVLGFPDCYLEYYDPAAGLMISYQIDLANIMCSRRGAILPTHYEQMAKAYAGRR